MKCALLLLLTTFGSIALAQPIYRCQDSLGRVVFQDRPCAQRPQESGTVQAHTRTMSARVPFGAIGDRNAARHTESRRRCETALRVAALCGKFAGMFSCDENGFRKSMTEDGSPRRPTIKNGSAFNMEQCAQQAAASGG